MYKIAVLPGDGIGFEVMQEATRVLAFVAEKYNLSIQTSTYLVGGAAIDAVGTALPQKTLEACEGSNAILFGSVGGPQWDTLPSDKQPERAALLSLRKHFDLFANLRPAIIFDSLRDASPLKSHRIPKAFNILIVRELTGGIYFGQPKRLEEKKALDTLVYHAHEVERIARLAFTIARDRAKKVLSVDKANVLNSMVFWRKIVENIAQEYPDIEFSQMYVDNVAMQLVANPSQFDVLLCPNMFGDILSDEASIITGSLGMLPSASIGELTRTVTNISRFGLYEPAGGSAPDIAGKGIANPIAQILSVAMMFKYSFNLSEAYDDILMTINTVLQKGFRTKDIMSSGCTEVGTTDMGDIILSTLKEKSN